MSTAPPPRLVIVRHLGGYAGRGENAADHVAGVIAAHAGDDRIQVAGLAIQVGLGKVGQVEPDRDRQAGQQQHDQEEKAKPVLPPKIFFIGVIP